MSDAFFESEEEVRAWMRELAAVSLDAAPLPDPHQLWWKAELLKRWDTQRRTAASIDRAERIQIGIGLAGALLLLLSLWEYVPAPTSALIFATVLALTVLAAVAALTLRQT